MKKQLFLAASFCLAGMAANAATVEVFGTNAVYGAGLGGGSTAAQSVALGPGSGHVVTFSSVTGLVGCCGGLPTIGPDGAPGSSNVTALNGISGISIPSRMFLAGVFVSSLTPPSGTAPATAIYTLGDLAASSFTPLLDQVFFIGDGLTGTGSGSLQDFIAPTGADTLLLGFVDAFGFSGTPSYYGDNPGSMFATFDITTTPAGVPLPASALLLLSGLGGVAALRRRRRAGLAAA